MRETLVTFETAKLAKEKGFEEEVLHFYCINKTCNYIKEPYEYSFRVNANQNSEDNFGYGETTSAPTQSLLQKWLREVHNIHIAVLPKILPSNEIKYYCFKGKIKKDFKDLYNTYEEALEKGLQLALNRI